MNGYFSRNPDEHQLFNYNCGNASHENIIPGSHSELNFDLLLEQTFIIYICNS
jgi:hypothetical protein